MSLPAPGPDRAAVVTGASSGIGAELARELSRRGHQVVLVARSADKLGALADELGDGAHVLAADLSDGAARAALLGRVEGSGLTPDVLVNNAGLSTLGPVHAADPGAEVNLIEVDVVAVAELCTRFLPGMVGRGRGALLNVASTAAFQPLPGQAGTAPRRRSCCRTRTACRPSCAAPACRDGAVPRPGQDRLRARGRVQRRGGRGLAAVDHVAERGRRREGRDRRAGQGAARGHPRHGQPGRRPASRR